MLKNVKLKENMRSLSEVVFCQHFIGLQGGCCDNENISFIRAINRHDDDIAKIPLFKICEDILSRDSSITIWGAVVGTVFGKQSVGSPSSCLLSFVKQLFVKSDCVFNPGIFDSYYASFEAFFYDDNVTIHDCCNLININSGSRIIEIEQGVTLEAIPPYDTVDISSNFLRDPANIHIGSVCLMKRIYSVDKIVSRIDENGNATNAHFPTETELQLFNSSFHFDNIVKALRVLKSSGVFRDRLISQEHQIFMPFGSRKISFSRNGDCAFQAPLSIGEDDVDQIKEYYDLIKNNSNKVISTAINRLSYGMERRTIEDKVMDFMIGLEALYLPNINTELSYRISLRVACRLHTTPTDRKDCFNFIKEMYSCRSKIVHGNANSFSEEKVDRLEEILRESIKLWFQNKDLFRTDDLDEAIFNQS